MENTFNLSYQKQLFNVAQKTIIFKKALLQEALLLANCGKEKEQDSPLGIMNFLKRKQAKAYDYNIAQIMVFLQCIDETVVKLESTLELKNDFKKEVFERSFYLDCAAKPEAE